jgi:transposase-like protein
VEKKGRNAGYMPEFKQYAVERMRVAVNIAALAKELRVPRVLLYRWRQRLDPLWWQSTDKGESFVPPIERNSACSNSLRQAKPLLAEKTLEVDFFKGALQKIEARRQKNASVGGTASTSKSER